MRALTFCDPKITSTRTAAGQFKGQFKGAMEESSGQVQAHPRSGVVMDTAAFKVSHSVVSNIDATALRAVIARSSSIGAMERYMRGFDFAPELTPYCHNTPQTVSIPVGRWMKVQGRFRCEHTY